MKDANKSEFVIKHREDVIDTILLRAKERRVLYSLLIVLLLTIAYENNGWLLSAVFSESHSAPGLGERKGVGVNIQLFKPVGKALDYFSDEYPQFWANTARQKDQLAKLVELAKNPSMKKEAMTRAFDLLQDISSFISHPVLNDNQKLKEIEKDISKISRSLGFKFVEKFDYRMVSFGRADKDAEIRFQRNLFDFAD